MSPEERDAEREALFASFQPLIQRLTGRCKEDPELRQELPGEIYCKFCALVDAYDPSRGVPRRAYLVRTLTAAVHTYTRSHWRRQHREVSLESSLEGMESQPSVDPVAEWDDGLVTQTVLEALPEAIRDLPLRQRQVVIWRFYESRSFAEIAELLSIRPATARSLLRHALANLRRQVSPLLPE